MVDVRYKGPSPQQRLNDRLKNSGGSSNPSYTVKHGEGARRTFHNVHESQGERHVPNLPGDTQGSKSGGGK
jgi:hypothetical protein